MEEQGQEEAIRLWCESNTKPTPKNVLLVMTGVLSNSIEQIHHDVNEFYGDWEKPGLQLGPLA